MKKETMFLCGLACVLAIFGTLIPGSRLEAAREDQREFDLSENFYWIDTHVHLDGRAGGGGQTDYDGAAQAALETMDGMGIRESMVMPPPQPAGHARLYDCEVFTKALEKMPGRFAFLCGGGSLNPMIQEARDQKIVNSEARDEFERKAGEIIRQGAAGFGEMTAEHLSGASWHPYESAPADHPLFLLLADIAAKHDVVIDIHLDVVLEDMALPDHYASPPNPSTLHANIAAFERLLAHNRQAKIIWVHAGWDQTGDRTVELSRALLEKHPNLYMSIKINPTGLPQNSPFIPASGIKSEWLDLIRTFPDRFMIGSDTFYVSPNIDMPIRRPPLEMSLMGLKMFLALLPPDLARKVGYENAARLYKLKAEN